MNAMYKKFRGEWFEMWLEDREAIAHCMRRNIGADIDAGYNPQGACILRQKAEAAAYEAETAQKIYEFALMDDEKVDRLCYADLLVRGAIA